jgi:hypothetical protein
MGSKENLSLRSPRSGRLEGRTAPIPPLRKSLGEY